MKYPHKKDVGAVVRKSGVTFRVWAPFATNVAVKGSFNDWSSDIPLESENDGYWAGEVRGAIAGQEYKYVITNGENTFYRNDPRALHLTTSAGNSIITDTTFDWGDDHFQPVPVEQQIIYELHVGTFFRPDPATVGTFQDVVDKLDYLAGLGVNMIELMPVSSMLMDRGWGYAIDYIYSVESLYGGRHDFLELIKAAHAKGIGIILDVVYNHFGPDNSLDLWRFDGWYNDDKGGIYFYNDWRASTPWGDTRPDYGRVEVQQYIHDNVSMWAHECRVDGLRVDSTIFIRNAKGYNDDPGDDIAEGWSLLQNITKVARKINPNLIVIAEDVGANDYIVKSVSEGGAGFDAQWDLGFPHAMRDVLRSNDSKNINLDIICNELTKRFNGLAFQRVIYTDSHDSAANGSARLNEVIAPGKGDGLFARRQMLIAATILLTTPGIPMLFQGQEFMEVGSFNDWRSIDWDKAERFKGITEAYRHLIALRRNQHDNTAGLMDWQIDIIHRDDVNKVLIYHRWKAGGPKDDTIIVINFGSQSFDSYDVPFTREGRWIVRFNSTWKGYSEDFKDEQVAPVEAAYSNGKINLPSACALIFSQDE